MAAEPRRLCGYRKVGALYLVGKGLPAACKKMPIELSVCPTCGTGIKPARGWTWVNARALTGGPCNPRQAPPHCKDETGAVTNCPFAHREGVGLLWVGKRFYSPIQFIREAMALGVSKRLHSPPKKLRFGETWCILAHKQGIQKTVCRHKNPDGQCMREVAANGEFRDCTMPESPSSCPAYSPQLVHIPAVFYAFKPQRLELIVTQTQMRDMSAEDIADYDRRSIKLVAVPDDDADHQGSVWDEERAGNE
jgi:hypothetical protein